MRFPLLTSTDEQSEFGLISQYRLRWGIALAPLFFGIAIILIAASGRRIEARDIG